MADDDLAPGDDRLEAAHLDDARKTLVYLVVPESPQYIAIMDVLETSITDLIVDEIAARLWADCHRIELEVLVARLDKLRQWGAVSFRTDASRIFRIADILARNWRYTATPIGRHVQRFYRKVLAGTPTVREIPLTSLHRVVEALEALVKVTTSAASTVEQISRLFVNHDDLDAALVGAEDNLAGLVDRFDLSDESASELKTLLVGYATLIAAELERGSARAHQALGTLQPRFGELAQEAVRASDARLLIERGALAASHGGRLDDWESLRAWFDPNSGRSFRFALRLVRALPGMHVNLRRLHSSSGAATSRSRALALAKACTNVTFGAAILRAALGDHPWRKLYGEADEHDGARLTSWHDGPHVTVPELLRATGRTGARGRMPAARDDTAARAEVCAARERRALEHAAAVDEVLSTTSGAELSERAARVALVSLLAAVRAESLDGRRTADRDGLACTLFHTGTTLGVLAAPTWCVFTPGRVPRFHRPGTVVTLPQPFVTREEPDPPRVLLSGSP